MEKPPMANLRCMDILATVKLPGVWFILFHIFFSLVNSDKQCNFAPKFTAGYYRPRHYDIYQRLIQRKGFANVDVCGEMAKQSPNKTEMDTNGVFGTCFLKDKSTCFGHLAVRMEAMDRSPASKCIFRFLDVSVEEHCNDIRTHFPRARRDMVVVYDLSDTVKTSVFVDKLFVEMRNYTMHFMFNFTLPNNVLLELGKSNTELVTYTAARIEITQANGLSHVVSKTSLHSFPSHLVLIYLNELPKVTRREKDVTISFSPHFIIPAPLTIGNFELVHNLAYINDKGAGVNISRSTMVRFDTDDKLYKYGVTIETFSILNRTFTAVSMNIIRYVHVPIALFFNRTTLLTIMIVPLNTLLVTGAFSGTGPSGTVPSIPKIMTSWTPADNHHVHECVDQGSFMETWKTIYNITEHNEMNSNTTPIRQQNVIVSLDNVTLNLYATNNDNETLLIDANILDARCSSAKKGVRKGSVDTIAGGGGVIQQPPLSQTDDDHEDHKENEKSGDYDDSEKDDDDEDMEKDDEKVDVKDEVEEGEKIQVNEDDTVYLKNDDTVDDKQYKHKNNLDELYEDEEHPHRGISRMSWWIMVVLGTISCIACLTVSLATVIVCVTRKSTGSINSRA